MIIKKIISVNTVIPNKGSNAGKTMYVINGEYWHNQEPKPTDTHVVLVEKAGKKKDGTEATFLNVSGYSMDSRMEIGDKIKTITAHDAGYSQALAFLLK
jgi:hypothetical protein